MVARFVVFDYVVVVVIVVVLLLLLFCQIRFRLGASFDPFGVHEPKKPKKKQRSHLETKNTSLFLIVRVNIHTT